MHIITLPLSVPVSGKSKFFLNLNQYRNAHHMSLNKAKIVFKELVQQTVALLPPMKNVRLTYTVYPGTKQAFDVSNVCSVADKFFSDALVELGKLPDDCYHHLAEINYRFGAVDKENPRIEVRIEDTSPMQITLNEDEIKEAIQLYVVGMGFLSPETSVAVNITGGGTGKTNSEYAASLEFSKASPVNRLTAVSESSENRSAPAPAKTTAEEKAPEAALPGKSSVDTQALPQEPDITEENDDNPPFAITAAGGPESKGVSLFNRPSA